MRRTHWMRSVPAAALLLGWLPIASADEVVAASQGGTYVLHMNGDQATSVTNDDGSVVRYRYDALGNQSGMTVVVDRVSLNLDHASAENGGGWVHASPLPPLIHTADANGRTVSATLYPGTWFDNGQWIIDVDSPAPIPVASLVYDDYGYLSSLTLNSGLSMQFGTPTPSGLVPQSLHGSDGTLLASVLAAGGTNAMGIAPTQLDAVATQLGLGANWAETLTFHRSANGQVTTARNATTGEVVLYLVDAGPIRVGYTPDGTAVFYDFTPAYGVGDDPAADPAAQLAGVAPTQIVMTAAGATGMYNDRPAEGAVYGAWNDAAGAVHFGRLTSEPESFRRMASQSSPREPRIGTDALVRHQSTVCVNEYCWVSYWYEWVDGPGGGSPYALT